MDIGFDDCITSVSDAVAKHISHPCVVKIRDKYYMGSSFSFKQVTESSIALFLRKINPRKALGYDHIPGKIIRIAHQELSAPITSLINNVISANAFPSVLKCAEISPGLKMIIWYGETIGPLVYCLYYQKYMKVWWTINCLNIFLTNFTISYVLSEGNIAVKV